MLRKIYIKSSKKAIIHGFETLYKSREFKREIIKMGISCFQLNILALTTQKNAISKEMTAISDQRELVTGQMNSIITSTTEWYKDKNVKILEAKDNQLDMELGQLETQLKDIESKMESFEKQRDNNIKNGVAKLA